MRRWLVGCATVAALSLGGAASASAQMASSGSMASHSAMMSSAGHTKETKMDVMMVNKCLAMPHDRMAKDAECKDYMKHHPDWMKHK